MEGDGAPGEEAAVIQWVMIIERPRGAEGEEGDRDRDSRDNRKLERQTASRQHPNHKLRSPRERRSQMERERRRCALFAPARSYTMRFRLVITGRVIFVRCG